MSDFYTQPRQILKLAEIRLAPGDIEGFDVGKSGSSPNRFKYTTPAGYDGLRLIADQPTRVRPRTSWADYTIGIGNGAGIVRIEGDVTIEMGGRMGISVGVSKEWGGTHSDGDLLRLQGTRIVSEKRGGKWGISSQMFDLDLEDCEFDLWGISEHSIYRHGSAKWGTRLRRCDFISTGGEHSKNTNRPFEVEDAPKAQYLAQDCRFRNWHGEFSSTGGAGITFQGAGYRKAVVERCAFFGPAHSSKCLMIDNGLSPIRDNERYYDENGVPNGPGAANGEFFIRDSGFSGPRAGQDIINGRFEMPLGPTWEHRVAEGVMIQRCAIYGEDTVANFKDLDRLKVVGSNTEGLRSLAEKHGMDTEFESILRVPGGGQVLVSEGYSS